MNNSTDTIQFKNYTSSDDIQSLNQPLSGWWNVRILSYAYGKFYYTYFPIQKYNNDVKDYSDFNNAIRKYNAYGKTSGFIYKKSSNLLGGYYVDSIGNSYELI